MLIKWTARTIQPSEGTKEIAWGRMVTRLFLGARKLRNIV